jgi:hypothetical protein
VAKPSQIYADVNFSDTLFEVSKYIPRSHINQSNPTIRSKKKNLGNPMPIVVRSASNPLISLNLNVLVD